MFVGSIPGSVQLTVAAEGMVAAIGHTRCPEVVCTYQAVTNRPTVNQLFLPVGTVTA